jgi:hypothetical protein
VTRIEPLRLTERQSRGLGALAARKHLRDVEDGHRREVNRNGAWCADRQRYGVLGLDFDAWHHGWADEVSTPPLVCPECEGSGTAGTFCCPSCAPSTLTRQAVAA